jgi:hypothetical protein
MARAGSKFSRQPTPAAEEAPTDPATETQGAMVRSFAECTVPGLPCCRGHRTCLQRVLSHSGRSFVWTNRTQAQCLLPIAQRPWRLDPTKPSIDLAPHRLALLSSFLLRTPYLLFISSTPWQQTPFPTDASHKAAGAHHRPNGGANDRTVKR